MATGTRIGVTATQKLRLTASLQASLRVLRADALGLARYLEEQAAEIPALIVGPAPVVLGEWLPRWSGALAQAGGGEAQVAAYEPSLIAHVLGSIDALVPPEGRHIALALAEALEPTGWVGRDPGLIATDLGVTETQVLAVLGLMQAIEPAGLFARDLAECLRLQAVDADCLDAVMRIMLARLDLVASGDWGGACAVGKDR